MNRGDQTKGLDEISGVVDAERQRGFFPSHAGAVLAEKHKSPLCIGATRYQSKNYTIMHEGLQNAKSDWKYFTNDVCMIQGLIFVWEPRSGVMHSPDTPIHFGGLGSPGPSYCLGVEGPDRSDRPRAQRPATRQRSRCGRTNVRHF